MVPAAAQTPPSVPPAALEQNLPSREQVTPPTPAAPQTARPRIDSRSAIVQPTCPFEDSALRLTLRRVLLVRPDGRPLQPAIARTLLRLVLPEGEQPLRVICTVRDQANALLGADGWIASVQVPAQSITAGELKLTVVTARITEVRVRGNPGPYRRLLQRRVAQLQALDPLNQRDAERALLLASDVPGLEIQLSLRPAGTNPGDVIGDLSIAYRPYALTASIQNLNSRALGPWTGYARAEFYGLTGRADLTYLGVSSTSDFQEQRVVQAGQLFGLGPAGTTLGGRFTYAWSRPDLGALDFRTDTLIAGLDVVRPLVRSVNVNLRAAAGLDYVDQKTVVGSGQAAVLLNLDKLRVAYARLSGELLQRGGGGRMGLSLRSGVEVRKGLAVLDATRTGGSASVLPSRIEGDARALVIRADADAVLGVGQYLSVAGLARVQWANHPLLNYEEFSIGNLTVGRGYDPGSNSGDRAVGLRGELRVTPPILRAVRPELYGSYDFVMLTNLDSASTEVDRHLRSVGAGVRLIFANQIAAEISYAHPLDRALLIDKAAPRDRVLVSLVAQLRGGARR